MTAVKPCRYSQHSFFLSRCPPLSPLSPPLLRRAAARFALLCDHVPGPACWSWHTNSTHDASGPSGLTGLSWSIVTSYGMLCRDLAAPAGRTGGTLAFFLGVWQAPSSLSEQLFGLHCAMSACETCLWVVCCFCLDIRYVACLRHDVLLFSLFSIPLRVLTWWYR